MSNPFLIHVTAFISGAAILGGSLVEGFGPGVALAGVLIVVSGVFALRGGRSLLTPAGLRQTLEHASESPEKKELQKATASIGGWVLILGGLVATAVGVVGSL